MKRTVFAAMFLSFFLLCSPISILALQWGVQDYVQTYVTSQPGGGGTITGAWGELSDTGSKQFSNGGFDLESMASATLQGAGISPLLTAYASIQTGGVFGGYAQASAIGIEYFQFAGLTEDTYRINASLSGSIDIDGRGKIQYGFIIKKGALDQDALNASESQGDLTLYDYNTPY